MGCRAQSVIPEAPRFLASVSLCAEWGTHILGRTLIMLRLYLAGSVGVLGTCKLLL